jgi:hypothetical protein
MVVGTEDMVRAWLTARPVVARRAARAGCLAAREVAARMVLASMVHELVSLRL